MPKETSIFDPISKQHIPVVADVIVIGGGIAGLSAAKKLAEFGKTSALFEQRKEFMLGASGINPGRMGLGFHYADPPTAFTYLKATIDFVKKYKKEGHDFRLGESQYGEDHPMRRGRYFIPEQSLVPARKLLKVYEGIGSEYSRLVKEDPANEVFGPPDSFYRMLPAREYKDDVNPDHITLAIETREQLLDVPRFRDYLVEQIETNPRIQSFKEAKVIKIERTNDAEYYIITIQHDGQIKKFAAPQLINASWESTDKLNQTLGSLMELGSRTNRIKILAEVELPDSLKDKPCMFFAIGPFCMFSNMQNGRGLITYAPKTNYVQSKDLALTAEEEAMLHEGFTPEKTAELGQKIIDGVAQFIPAMKDAQLISIRGGVVKTYGDFDLCDPNSDFHKRRELGIQEIAIDALEISSMKLLYGEENAGQAVELLELFEKTKVEISEIAEELARYYSARFHRVSSPVCEPIDLAWQPQKLEPFFIHAEKFLTTELGIVAPDRDAVLGQLRSAFALMVTKAYQEQKTLSKHGSSKKNDVKTSKLTAARMSGVGEQQSSTDITKRVIAPYFNTYLRRYCGTKEINGETDGNKSKVLLTEKIKATIKHKTNITCEINRISASMTAKDDACLAPSKARKFSGS